MALFADDAEDRVSQLIALTERLTERLAQETRAFENRRPQDVLPGLEETQKLANLYRHESARVKADRSLIEAADLKQRIALMQATEAFEAVLARHARAVEAARTVSEGLVRTIAAEVAEVRSPGSYGAGGQAQSGDARAVTLNQKA
ncbi:MAG TPA: flagellar basal body protein [Brevundimonas sp.]|uniref:flagellar basal body protein n=1 Tax=Brevundimonas sp. TaxID=1871086 RepID=UPI002B86F892|nr:flagellar basal body protein [Brevundimonas sp.]HRH20387.1 flagellar basal body protein [Brevundimonas sp.]